MKSTSKILLAFLFIASVGRAQVVLPPSSEYNNPYNYYKACVDNNGEEGESVCEQQTSSLYPEEAPAPAQAEESPAPVNEQSAQAQEPVQDEFSVAYSAGQ